MWISQLKIKLHLADSINFIRTDAKILDEKYINRVNSNTYNRFNNV